MKKVFSFILVALVATTAWSSDDRYLARDFEVVPGARFSLDSHKGKIKIGTTDQDRIEVKAHVHFGDIEDANPDLLEFVEVNILNGEDYVDVDVKFNQEDARSWWDNLSGKGMTWPYVDFEILVPDTASLKIDTHKGELDLQVPSGEIRIDSHKGTGTIAGVRNNLRLDTHKGQFDVQILDLHDLDIDTHKGNLDIAIENASDVSVNADSYKGNLRFKGRDIQTRSDKKGKNTKADFREGTGENRIRIETHKGDITLDFRN